MFGLTLAILCSLADAGAPAPPLLHVRGPDIVDGSGHPVLLRGVAFGNEVWNNTRLPRKAHSEADYQRVAAMGMNAVRFYLNYNTFESDAAPGTSPTGGSGSTTTSRGLRSTAST